jgi:hypothetical protein
MFQETISLILKHSDISTNKDLDSISNGVGSWSNGKQKTTWRVNLRNLMSNKIYDENDTFVLRLNQLSYATSAFPVTPADQQLIVNVSGLNFLNATYNVKTGNRSLAHQMLVLNMAVEADVIEYSPNIAIANFGKATDNVEITIELLRTIDNAVPMYYSPNRFPHMVYSFDIYPVKK